MTGDFYRRSVILLQFPGNFQAGIASLDREVKLSGRLLHLLCCTSKRLNGGDSPVFGK